MTKIKKILLSILLLMLLAGIIIYIITDKKIDINSKELQTLYESMDQDLEYCDGMFLYLDKSVNVSDLSDEKKMCFTYIHMDKNDLKEEKLDLKKKKDYCKVGDSNNFLKDENTANCTIQNISKNSFENKYKMLFNEDLKENKTFSTSSKSFCYYDETGENYICGLANERTVVVGWEPTVYRYIKKATKTKDTIEIYDYFLIINAKSCYLNNSQIENEKCSKKYQNKKNADISRSFVRKYGSLYKHTFKKGSDGNFYYYSSTPIKK